LRPLDQICRAVLVKNYCCAGGSGGLRSVKRYSNGASNRMRNFLHLIGELSEFIFAIAPILVPDID
jgi:hypothetical protein